MFIKSLILVSVVLIVFYRVLQLDFQMEWDDYWVVINDYTEKGFYLKNVNSVLLEFYHSQYSPVNEYYYMLIREIVGYNPYYYHLISLLIHVANVILVFYLVSTICNIGLDYPSYQSINIAFFTAMIFAVHPLNLEPVAWLAASKILIYSFFYLIALHLYINYLIHGKKYFLYLTILAFIVSFGAKEQAVVFPFCIILLDVVWKKKLFTKWFFIEKITFFSIAIVMGILTIRSQGEVNPEAIDQYNIQERLMLSFYTLFEYIAKCLIPIRTSHLYPFPFRPEEMIPWWLYIYPISLLLSLLMLIRHIYSITWLYFGLLFFFIHIIVALHVINLSRHSVVADRYVYLSSIGIGFLISRSCISGQRMSNWLHINQLCLIIYITFLSILTYIHLPVWKNSLTLKREMKEIIRNRDDFEIIQQKYARPE